MIRPWKVEWLGSRGRTAVGRMGEASLTEKVTVEQRLRGGEGESQADMWG